MSKTRKAAPPADEKQALWTAIRKLKRFTATEAETAARIDGTKTTSYFLGLVAAKIIRRVAPADMDGWAIYELADDRGVLAPRVDQRGKEVPPNEQERAWFAMKALGSFTAVALAATAEARAGAIRTYLSKLQAAGYLDVQHRRGIGPSVYTMRPRMWTGRRAPVIRADGVYDPNRDCLMGAGK